MIIPTYLVDNNDMEVSLQAAKSVRATAGDTVDILYVDDGSPARDLVEALGGFAEADYQAETHEKHENTGYSRTVNVGLRRALDEGRDAITLNADMEMETPMWLSHCRATKDGRHEDAGVVGGLLLFPSGLVQHAGIYFSLITRTFDHMYKYAPGNLPNALQKRDCPVTGAFQYIRHSTLQKVGLYDENFFMGWEDVDYCIRVFLAGLRCVYNPNVRGYHHEMMFRGRPNPKLQEWQAKSFIYLCAKYREQSFADFVPYW